MKTGSDIYHANEIVYYLNSDTTEDELIHFTHKILSVIEGSSNFRDEGSSHRKDTSILKVKSSSFANGLKTYCVLHTRETFCIPRTAVTFAAARTRQIDGEIATTRGDCGRLKGRFFRVRK